MKTFDDLLEEKLTEIFVGKQVSCVGQPSGLVKSMKVYPDCCDCEGLTVSFEFTNGERSVFYSYSEMPQIVQ